MDDIAQELASIRERVTYLEDRHGILDAVSRYARGIDRHDVDILASAFHEDAIDHHGAWVGRVPDFVSWANQLHEDISVGHAHNITTHTVEITGGTAHAESYVIFVLRREDSTVRVGGGRYLDRLEKRDGAWRISLRRLIHDWGFVADGSIWGDVPYEVGRWDRQDSSYQRPLVLPADALARLAARYAAQ